VPQREGQVRWLVWEVSRFEAPAALENAHSQACLGQPAGGDAPAESGSNDNGVVSGVHMCSYRYPARVGFVSGLVDASRGLLAHKWFVTAEFPFLQLYRE
jgi:hypothetical protein